MSKLILTVGIPGSGKSTWSQQYIRENPNTVRLNSDKFREMLFAYNPSRVAEYWSHSNLQDNESIVRFVIKNLTESLLENGINVIVDGMNLKKTTISLFLELAAKTQSSAVIKEFNTPLNTCIQRDQQRERYVGKIYITKKQEQFTKLKNTEFYTALSKLI